MQHLKLNPSDKQEIITSLNRVIGVIQNIKSDVEGDHACDQTLHQVLAARGALATIGSKMINKGILSCLNKFSKKEIEQTFKTMFKLN